MDLHELSLHLEQSAGIRLLKSDNAAILIDFFRKTFSLEQRKIIAYSELCKRLQEYNEAADTPLKNKASAYIDTWADDKHRYLRKYYILGQDEPVTELSYEVEQIIELSRSLQKTEFVGGSSRLQALFSSIDQLARGLVTDPKEQIKRLKNDKKKIDDQIYEIQEKGQVRSWDEAKIRDFVLHLLEGSRKIDQDFSVIDEIFRTLAHKVKINVLTSDLTKGQILQQVLDVHDSLEQSDQGRCFQGFWDFLMSEGRQEELSEWIDAILKNPTVRAYFEKNPKRNFEADLRFLKTRLLTGATKVLHSQHRLSKELRRLLHQSSSGENNQVSNSIREIKTWFLEQKDVFEKYATKILLDVEHFPEVYLPMERPLWKASKSACIIVDETLVIGTQNLDADTSFFSEEEILQSWQVLERLSKLLENNGQISLGDVFASYPVKQGIQEIATYVALALKFSQHTIISVSKFERHLVKDKLNLFCVALPEIYFKKSILEA